MQTIAGLLWAVGSLWMLIKLFQKKGILHGILGLISGGLYPFFWGLIHIKEEEFKKPMYAWLGAIVIDIILFFVGGSAAPAEEALLLILA